jgi:hypothetical protein
MKPTPLAFLLTVLCLLVLPQCGYTVGDPCTTRSDCGDEICLTDVAFPGGYCTETCKTDDDCPNGTVCGKDHQGNPVCLLACRENGDCRDGYGCFPSSTEDGPTVCLRGAF